MEKVRILGFDPGTANLGYATIFGSLKDKKPTLLEGGYGLITSTKKDGDIRKRADALGTAVELKIMALAPTHIVIEDYTEQGVKSGTTYKDMAILIEHMRMVCRNNGYEADIWTNAEWKKHATGRSGLNKNQVQHFVQHHVLGTEILGSRQSDTHVWDSAGIAYSKFRQLQGD